MNGSFELFFHRNQELLFEKWNDAREGKSEDVLNVKFGVIFYVGNFLFRCSCFVILFYVWKLAIRNLTHFWNIRNISNILF